MTRQDPDPSRPTSEEPAAPQASAPQAEDRAVTRAREEQERHLRRARQGRVAKVLFALAILVILIIFVIANSQDVDVDYVFVTRQTRLIWIMLVCAFIGGIIGYTIGRPGKELRRFRDRRPGDEKKP